MEIELDERLLPPAEPTRGFGEKDERRIVPDVTKAPWALICCLEYRETIKWPPFSRWVPYGTGWLAGPDKVVTAAHCVQYPEGHPKWTKPIHEIRVSPGRQGSKSPFGHQTSSRFISGWDNSDRGTWTIQRDFAVIHLPKPFRGLEGGFEFGHSRDADSLIGQKVHVSGYPVGKEGEVVQLYHQDEVVKIGDGVVHYRSDTTAGQSGAPVFLVHPTSPGRGRVEVVAIHRGEVDNGKETNWGPLLSGETAELVAQWVKDGPGAGGAWV